MSLPADDPGAFPITWILASATNAAAHFTGSPLGSQMAVPGSATLCLFQPCPDSPGNVVIPLTESGTRAVGLGGQIVTSGLVSFTISFAPWSTGTVTAGGESMEGYLRDAAGQDVDGVVPGGSAQLVTPLAIQNSIGEVVPAFGVLTLQFVPEPGSLLLAPAGTAGLGLAGRRRFVTGRPARKAHRGQDTDDADPHCDTGRRWRDRGPRALRLPGP